jgi:predicted phosphoribosyltransferase
MAVAIQAVRQLGAKRVIAAAPVSSREACDACSSEGATCVCLATPDPFHAVGEWYKDFRQVEDDEVQKLLAAN